MWFDATLTGWDRFRLKEIVFRFRDKEGTYDLPVTWKQQKTLDRPYRIDNQAYAGFEDIRVNGKDAAGLIRWFRSATIVSCTVDLYGEGKEDFRINKVYLTDNVYRNPEKNLCLIPEMDKVKIRYNRKKAKIKLDDLPEPARIPKDTEKKEKEEPRLKKLAIENQPEEKEKKWKILFQKKSKAKKYSKEAV